MTHGQLPIAHARTTGLASIAGPFGRCRNRCSAFNLVARASRPQARPCCHSPTYPRAGGWQSCERVASSSRCSGPTSTTGTSLPNAPIGMAVRVANGIDPGDTKRSTRVLDG